MTSRFSAFTASICLASIGVVCQVALGGDDLAISIGRCAAIAEGGQRLACFDRVAAPLQNPPPAPTTAIAPPPRSVPVPALTQAQARPEQFGSENLPMPAPSADAPPRALDQIVTDVTNVTVNSLGRFTVFLANGQIWQQVLGDTDQARFPKTGKTVVTISRGALGSYNLAIEGVGRTFKVRRLK